MLLTVIHICVFSANLNYKLLFKTSLNMLLKMIIVKSSLAFNKRFEQILSSFFYEEKCICLHFIGILYIRFSSKKIKLYLNINILNDFKLYGEFYYTFRENSSYKTINFHFLR